MKWHWPFHQVPIPERKPSRALCTPSFSDELVSRQFGALQMPNEKQDSLLEGGTDPRAGDLGSDLCYLRAVGPEASYFISPSLGCPICKMKVVMLCAPEEGGETSSCGCSNQKGPWPTGQTQQWVLRTTQDTGRGSPGALAGLLIQLSVGVHPRRCCSFRVSRAL